VFSSISFTSQETVVHGETYLAVNDEALRGQLFRLFGPRLSVGQLESNITSLEQAHWGWLEGTDSTVIDLRRDIARQRVADLCVLALSSLSPNIVSAVQAVLSTLADSIQREQSSLFRHTVEVNLYARKDSTLTLVNSRLDVKQSGRKWMMCLCGWSTVGMSLSLQIRRIAFSRLFQDMITSGSPALHERIRGGTVLLPPSPELVARRAETEPGVGVSSRTVRAQVQLVQWGL
jgi:hypothetical protein